MVNEYMRAKLLRDLPYLIIFAATFIGLLALENRAIAIGSAIGIALGSVASLRGWI